MRVQVLYVGILSSEVAPFEQEAIAADLFNMFKCLPGVQQAARAAVVSCAAPLTRALRCCSFSWHRAERKILLGTRCPAPGRCEDLADNECC